MRFNQTHAGWGHPRLCVGAFERPREIPHPAENAWSEARETLGRTLFFDPRLSASGTVSCATCHNPAFDWGDGMARGVGHAMKTLERRTPTILNLAWGELFFWDGRAESLEAQALGPIQAAGEMNMPLETLVAELGLAELVRLAANENPLGPSPRVVEAVRREAGNVHLYPDGGSTAVRDGLGRSLGISPAQIVVGNGADELITLIALAAFDPGDEVVMPHPSFEPYATGATIAGARMVHSPLRGYETDLDDMRRRVTARTKAVFLCSPAASYITGTILDCDGGSQVGDASRADLAKGMA